MLPVFQLGRGDAPGWITDNDLRQLGGDQVVHDHEQSAAMWAAANGNLTWNSPSEDSDDPRTHTTKAATPLGLAQSDPGTATILCNELHASGF